MAGVVLADQVERLDWRARHAEFVDRLSDADVSGVLGLAIALVATVRATVTIDWTVRENVRPRLRVLVKRILPKHGCRPDQQDRQNVLEQGEVLSAEWATA